MYYIKMSFLMTKWTIYVWRIDSRIEELTVQVLDIAKPFEIFYLEITWLTYCITE